MSERGREQANAHEVFRAFAEEFEAKGITPESLFGDQSGLTWQEIFQHLEQQIEPDGKGGWHTPGVDVVVHPDGFLDDPPSTEPDSR